MFLMACLEKSVVIWTDSMKIWATLNDNDVTFNLVIKLSLNVHPCFLFLSYACKFEFDQTFVFCLQKMFGISK